MVCKDCLRDRCNSQYMPTKGVITCVVHGCDGVVLDKEI
jgi:hypothetical protein